MHVCTFFVLFCSWSLICFVSNSVVSLFFLLFSCLIYSFLSFILFFFFKQKTAYELRISDWSSDVCSSDLKICRQLSLPSSAASSRPIATSGSCSTTCTLSTNRQT